MRRIAASTRRHPWFWLLLLPSIALAGLERHVKHDHWTDEYDDYFRKYTKHYFGPHIDWHWFKAQAIAESGLRPDATSPVGARGLMQIMPPTYKEIRRQNPFLSNIDEPKWNIAAGIFYDRQLYRKWKKFKQVQTQERLFFAFGSYNAGYGNVLKAYKRAVRKHGEDEVKRWSQVSPHAPRETRAYVKRINDLMASAGMGRG